MNLNLRYPPTPEFAAQHAELVLAPAKSVSGVDLDYSPRSLAEVDKIIESMRQDGVDAEQIAETLFAFGCYVGEVFVRNNNARWTNAADTAMKDLAGFPIVLELGPDNICNPIGKVFKRMINGGEDGLEFFYRVFTTAKGENDRNSGTPTRNRRRGFWAKLFRR
jgi:hypothetical protein